MDVATFNECIMGPAHVENMTDLAVRTALAYRTVSHITFPVDFQEMEVKSHQRSKRNILHHTSHAEAAGAMLADPGDLDRAAEILNEGKKVAILAGRGALHATAELEKAAETLAAPIVKALLGRAAISDDFAAVAHACGGAGFTAEDPADCGRTVEEFLNSPGPAILQAVVDPLEPPLPAKVTADQALKFAESLVRGEPNRGKIALTACSDKVREMV